MWLLIVAKGFGSYHDIMIPNGCLDLRFSAIVTSSVIVEEDLQFLHHVQQGLLLKQAT